MLRRIYSKLFVVILGTNALLALLMYIGASWSFDHEFREHLRRQELVRLDSIASELADGYGRQGNWSWVADDPHRWADLLRRYLSPPRAKSGAGSSNAGNGAPSPEATAGNAPAGIEVPRAADTITFSPRLLLLDAGHRLMVGPAELVPRAVLRPIEWRSQVVGYLGYLPRDDLVQALDRLFAERQELSFAMLSIGMLITAILLSAGIARWISRPVQQLADGTRALKRGDYAVRTNVSGGDELAQLAADFNSLGQVLLEARQARQRWIVDISHELRTPLTVLRAEVEALQDGVRKPNAETLSSLSQEVSKLSRLVEDLHTLSQSDQGALEFKMAPMDLGRFVQEELETCQDLLTDAGLSVQLALAPQSAIRGDPSRLSQLLDNLRQNTLRYTDAPGQLRVATRHQPGQVVLEWEDSAPGVPAQDLARLTVRLFRVESSRSRAGGGSGLGLSIAQAIVEAHGGQMRASASALGGLAWTIAFPAI
jgi:two-component system sensor histidine kinase BaeS